MLSLDDRINAERRPDRRSAILRDDPRASLCDLSITIPNPAESEWIVRRKIQTLRYAGRERDTSTRSHRFDGLSLWRSIQESEDVAGLIALEHDHSYAVAERQVNQYLSDPDFRPLCDLLREEETKLPPNTRALFLTHATVFAPGAYRISSLFEQLHRSFRTPTVLFYPGTWNHTLNYMGLRSDDQALGSYRVKIYGRDS